MRQTPLDPEQLKARLRHVRWIGGGSGAGKSTIARRLATDYGLRLYSTDAVMAEHAGRSDAAETPLLQAFLAMDMDERWANRSPDVMFQTFHWFAGEGFDLIVEDLLALPEDPPILVEGFRLLPRLVEPLLAHKDQAVWLVPTPEFRRAAFDSRGFTWVIPRKTSKPEQALSNLLVRDQHFTDEVVTEATTLQLHIIEVDGAVSVDEMTTRVARHLDLSVL
jgi:2-phosphoglycerate kinase